LRHRRALRAEATTWWADSSRVVGAHPEVVVLRDIHGDVGVSQQGGRVLAVGTGDHDLDAGLHVQVDVVHPERGVQGALVLGHVLAGGGCLLVLLVEEGCDGAEEFRGRRCS